MVLIANSERSLDSHQVIKIFLIDLFEFGKLVKPDLLDF